MAYGLDPHGGESYGGATTTSPGGGVVIVDPASPGGSGWRFLNQGGGGGPYGAVSYGGGGILGQSGSGGISATPDPLLARIRLDAWWSNAPYLRVMRIVGDERTPVRNAYPITVTTPTRRNRCTNPSAEVDTAGWLAGANTTLSRATGTATLAGTAAFRLTATAAGTVNASIPVALPLPDGAPQVSLAIKLSALPSGSLLVTATWQDAAGGALGTTSAAILSANLAPYVARWDRTSVLPLTVPVGAAAGTLAMSIAGMAISATADIDAVLIEGGTSSGVYFDGTYQYAAWAGTAHASVSTLAALQSFYDTEAPFDVPVSYELTAPDQPGYLITSEPVTLDSQDRTWLSHPTLGTAMVVTVAAEPEQTRAIARGVHTVIGRARPIAVSASRRQAPAATLTVYAEDFTERDRLLDMLDDGAPLLLRAPARLGHGLGEWLSIGDVSTKGPGHGAWEATRIFTLPYQVVDPPVADADATVAA